MTNDKSRQFVTIEKSWDRKDSSVILRDLPCEDYNSQIRDIKRLIRDLCDFPCDIIRDLRCEYVICLSRLAAMRFTEILLESFDVRHEVPVFLVPFRRHVPPFYFQQEVNRFLVIAVSDNSYQQSTYRRRRMKDLNLLYDFLAQFTCRASLP